MSYESSDPSMAEQAPIHQAIAGHLIEFLPTDWLAAELRLKWPSDEDDPIEHDVVNPDSGDGWSVSEALLADVQLLEKHRRKYALNWRSAVYMVRKDASGNWQVNADFV